MSRYFKTMLAGSTGFKISSNKGRRDGVEFWYRLRTEASFRKRQWFGMLLIIHCSSRPPVNKFTWLGRRHRHLQSDIDPAAENKTKTDLSATCQALVMMP